jgi:hypothetical protein
VRSVSVFRVCLTVASALALTAGVAREAQAQPAGRGTHRACTNASLRGTFAFTASGVTLMSSPVPTPLLGPFASGGTATFDGRGRFTLTATSSFNGVVQGPATIGGGYAVNPDCTYTSQAENGVTFRAVIVDEGDELLILQTTPGVVISGRALRQGRDRDRLQGQKCGPGALRGSYGFLADGVAGPPTVPADAAGPLKGVGTVAFERDGSFTLVATRSVNGVLDPDPLTLTGRYTFTGDCTFRMAFDVGFTFTAAIADGGDEILFIETDPGTTLTVRAKKI